MGIGLEASPNPHFHEQAMIESISIGKDNPFPIFQAKNRDGVSD